METFQSPTENRSKNCPTNGLKSESKLLLAKMDFDGWWSCEFPVERGEEETPQQQFMHSLASLSANLLHCQENWSKEFAAYTNKSTANRHSITYLPTTIHACSRAAGWGRSWQHATSTLCQTAICSSLFARSFPQHKRGGSFHRQVWRNVKFIHVKLIYV